VAHVPDLPNHNDETHGQDGVVPVMVGTALWAVAFFVLLPFRDRLEAAGTDWWLWVCVTGFLLGLPGIWYVRRRRAAYRQARRELQGSRPD
jgi:hypothetical protein